MGMVNEFKTFVARGNVIDLAVGVIMGAAFGKIVSSLVDNVLMPPLGYLIGGVNFGGLSIKLPELKIPTPDPEHPAQMVDTVLPAVEIKYGLFLQSMVDFFIVAACVFILIKAVNAFLTKKEAAPAPPTAQETLLAEIRDLLKPRA
jgi:large conductance mechanosensitive channel